MAVEAGHILQGRYRLDALIGRGGMGHVFAATDLEDGSEVAVKVVSRLLVDDQIMVRLHREAEAAARIRSDYVPRVLTVSDTMDRELFLVMERLHGEPLSQRIREGGGLPWTEVQHVAEDVLRGLIDAHTAGIVHRDLKPSNVFISEKGGRERAFVLDFGVCKMDGLDHERLTGTGESIGTVAYMAPEQIRGAAKVDDRADLYAFGALVFEMLTGRLPHEGPSQMAILASKLEKPAARLRDHVLVDIPVGLDDLVARTLERDPKDRHASAQELLKAWRAVSKGNLTPASSLKLVDPDPSSQNGMEDPPTQLDRPGGAGGQGPTMVVSPMSAPRMPTTARMPLSRPVTGPIPFEPNPTETALTSPGGERRQKSTRFALALAGCAMVAGLVVIGISVAHSPAHPTAPSAVVSAEPPAGLTTAAPTEDPAVATSAEVVDLADPPPVAGSSSTTPPRDAKKLPGNRTRQPTRPPPRNTSPASSSPHITNNPRY